MNYERLLRLADLLEADAVRPDGIRFNLGCLVEMDMRDDRDKVALNCGTQACAVGLAAISGAFENEGLGYTLEHGGFSPIFAGEVCEWDWAAEKLFEIEPNVVDFLFTTNGYSTGSDLVPMIGADAERQVAQRIRDLVSGKVEVPALDDDEWEEEADAPEIADGV
jgi:hypothetical protein